MKPCDMEGNGCGYGAATASLEAVAAKIEALYGVGG
jgi:hypothetical protein